MALISELKTLITADNKQFKAIVNDTISQSKKIGAAFNNLGKGLAVAFAGIGGISLFKSMYEDLDRLTASADKLKISAESFQFLEYAARRSDIEIGTLEMGIRKLRLSLGKAASDQGITDALKKLNLSASELKSLSIDEAYFKIAEALGQVKDSAEQARLGTVLMGKSFQEQTELVNGNIKELKKNFADIGGAANVSAFGNIDRQMDDLVTKSDIFKRNFFLAFGPSTLSLLNGLTSSVSKISNGISQGATATSQLFGGGYDPNAAPSYADLSEGINQYNRRQQRASAQSSMSTTGVSEATIKGANQGLEVLAVASTAASAALRKVGESDLKTLLGITNTSGADYLSSILTPIKQVEDSRFTEIASQLRDNIASGTTGFGANNQTLIASLKSIVQENSSGLNAGESNSGMVNALKDLQDATMNLKSSQKVIIELKYDQNGIITAFTSSSAFGAKAAEVVQNLASQEARATTMS